MLWSKIRNRWQDLIDGFWFIPGLVFLLGPCLAWIFLLIDQYITHPVFILETVDTPSAVRSLLSTMSGALISITALVFSITLVTLQLVSSQFTPRALRGLLSDRRTQVMVGGLVGIFAYCQMVMINVRDDTPASPSFVPPLSSWTAIFLAFFGLVLLIFFISHTVYSIQIANIAARITRNTMYAIAHPYPPNLPGLDKECDGDAIVESWRADGGSQQLFAKRQGYVQTIAIDSLYKLVRRNQLKLYLHIYPGLFVTRQQIVAEVWFPPQCSSIQRERSIRQIQTYISLRNERDLEQDAAFGTRQLADISLRALSPAINDPTTAVLCIDYLGSLLELLVQQENHTREPFCYSGVLIVSGRTLPEYSEVLLEIGRYAYSNARVVVNLLQVLENVGKVASNLKSPNLPFLKVVAEAIAYPALDEARTDIDRVLIKRQLERVLECIEAIPAPDLPTAQTGLENATVKSNHA